MDGTNRGPGGLGRSPRAARGPMRLMWTPPAAQCGPQDRRPRLLKPGRFVVAPLSRHKNQCPSPSGPCGLGPVPTQNQPFFEFKADPVGQFEFNCFYKSVSNCFARQRELGLLALYFGSEVGRKISGGRRRRATSLWLECEPTTLRYNCFFVRASAREAWRSHAGFIGRVYVLFLYGLH